jgi:hypothetical protein
MTPEAQRIAIAEACGYTNVRYDYANGSDTFKSWLADHPSFAGSGVPDYLNDLNAIHEAEETLNYAQKEDYVVHLANAVQFRRTKKDIHSDYWCVATSTATQRSEAFLRTIGKWVE